MESAAGTGNERGLSPAALLWVYALTIVAVGSLPRLPAYTALAWLGVLLLGGALLLPARARLLPFLFAVLAGAGWSLWHNHRALEQRLPFSAHGGDFLLELEVVSLPQVRTSEFSFGDAGEATSLRFSARVLQSLDGDTSPSLRGQLLDLTWYRVDEKLQGQLRAGSRWLLPLRLKRPRGSVNPHGFDYEGWLLRRGVYATGYVRPRNHPPQLLGEEPGLPALRHWLRDRLVGEAESRGELLSALLLGDRSGLSDGDRQLLRETGTAHLLAISGLHVGMVAGFFLLLGSLLGRVIGLFTGATPRAVALIFALAGSLAYTLLAGAPLSARRALVMIWVLLLAWQWRRRIGAGFAYSLALALVLTLQPLAFYGAGFWLSFMAVGALLLGFSGRLHLSDRSEDRPQSGRRLLDGGMGLLRSQWLVAVALLLPSLAFFSGFSPGGVLLNLIAIPWLGFLVLPALMLGALMMGTAAGGWCIDFAAWQLDLLMHFLEAGRNLLPSWQTLGPPSAFPLLVLAALGALLLLLPPGLPGRRLGWLFLLPPLLPFLPQTNEGEELRVTVLDVGQGLAVVLRTPQQRLLYDTGPLSGSGWSAGSQIIAPYLLGEGMPALDTVVVSHGDRDHAGGFAGLAENVSPGRIVAPGILADSLSSAPQRTAANCRAGGKEMLGDLDVLWLWPEDGNISGQENDHSCVALVEWRGVRILLAGDISSRVEQQLALNYPDLASVDLLIAPHHGSRSSSSAALIRWAQPANVVFSAGFRHHFGHPHPEVVARYRDAGARTWNTAASGAVTFAWSGAKAPRISPARDGRRFWYRTSSGE